MFARQNRVLVGSVVSKQWPLAVWASGVVQPGLGGPLWVRGKKTKKQATTHEEADVFEFDVDEVHLDLDAHVDHLRSDLSRIRGGVPSPDIVDHVDVEAYGSPTPLNALGQTALKNPQLLVVTPYDVELCQSIVDGIVRADMGLNPQVVDGRVHVPLPKMTTETRKQLAKAVASLGEEAKQRVRNRRKKWITKVKGVTGVSSDDTFAWVKDIESAVSVANDSIAALVQEKVADVQRD
jgi:ribosome recycling factor